VNYNLELELKQKQNIIFGGSSRMCRRKSRNRSRILSVGGAAEYVGGRAETEEEAQAGPWSRSRTEAVGGTAEVEEEE
jgi:hypothetical protein